MPNVKKKNKSGYFSFFHKMGQSEWIQEAQVNAFATYIYTARFGETREMEPVLNLFMQLCNIAWKDQAWGR